MNRLLVALCCLLASAHGLKVGTAALRKWLGAAAVASTFGTHPSFAATEESVVVLGAGGKTGSQIVSILAKQGVKVQPAYARQTENRYEGVENVLPPLVADVTKPDSLPEALKGAKSVIFAASASNKGGKAADVDFLGVKNTAEAAVADKVPQLVVISSAAVTRPNSLGYKVTNLFGGIMGFKIQGEDALRAAYAGEGAKGLSYAIIRPGGLVDGPSVGPSKIELNQGDTIAGEINRSDVAECAAAAAISKTIPSAVTFEISELGRTGPLEGGLKSVSGYEQVGPTYDESFKGLKSNFYRVD